MGIFKALSRRLEFNMQADDTRHRFAVSCRGLEPPFPGGIERELVQLGDARDSAYDVTLSGAPSLRPRFPPRPFVQLVGSQRIGHVGLGRLSRLASV